MNILVRRAGRVRRIVRTNRVGGFAIVDCYFTAVSVSTAATIVVRQVIGIIFHR